MIIKLVRHAESEANTNKVDPALFPDSKIILTDYGVAQALDAGKEIGADFISEALLFRSPYFRTRETSIGMTIGAGLEVTTQKWIEEVCLREIEVGYSPRVSQEELREKMGWFYYRFEQGESPSDVLHRISSFCDHLLTLEEKKIVIVTHGMTLRLLVMKFLDLTVEEYELLKNPPNASVTTVYTPESLHIYEQEKKNNSTKPVLGVNKYNGTVVCSNMERYDKEFFDYEKIFAERALKIRKSLKAK